MYKVLLVEDEKITRTGLRYMFDWLSVDCVVIDEAVDGNDGLAKIAAYKPDIVITDVRMPFKDGLTMLKEAKAEYDFKAIVLTGFAEFEYAKQAIALGVSDYILKPVNFDELNAPLLKLTAELAEVRRRTDWAEINKNLDLYKNILDISAVLQNIDTNDLCNQLIIYIKTNYMQRINIADVANHFQISKVSLNNKFKEVTNYTFNDFLNRYRILKAIEFLRSGDNMVYEVALNVGFQDYKYFSQVFKKYVGCSPTEFVAQ